MYGETHSNTSYWITLRLYVAREPLYVVSGDGADDGNNIEAPSSVSGGQSNASCLGDVRAGHDGAGLSRTPPMVQVGEKRGDSLAG